MSHAEGIPYEAIRERAYDLWERHHRPEGFSIELWLMAERELRAEREAKGPPADGAAAPAPSDQATPAT